jgi:signal peptidase II
MATLFVLGYMYRQTPRDDRFQIASIALICGGAVGNLFDRIRSARGVVDFIDIGIGTHRFWTFNLADLAVTLGTAMLTWILCVRAAKEESGRTLAATGPLDEPS